jgi:hypothetical protein
MQNKIFQLYGIHSKAIGKIFPCTGTQKHTRKLGAVS